MGRIIGFFKASSAITPREGFADDQTATSGGVLPRGRSAVSPPLSGLTPGDRPVVAHGRVAGGAETAANPVPADSSGDGLCARAYVDGSAWRCRLTAGHDGLCAYGRDLPRRDVDQGAGRPGMPGVIGHGASPSKPLPGRRRVAVLVPLDPHLSTKRGGAVVAARPLINEKGSR